MCDYTLIQSAKKIANTPDVILVDEAHNSKSYQYEQLFGRFPDAVKIGFTATPVRLGRKQLGSTYDDIVVGVEVDWLIEQGYLSPYKLYCNVNVDFSDVKVSKGDYDVTQLSKLMEHERVYQETTDLVQTKLSTNKIIIYTVSIKSAEETARYLCDAGFSAAAVSSKTPKKEREETLEGFKNNDLQILTNAYLLGEGVDVPDCDAVIDLAKTKSLARYVQKTMRCMRADPDNPNKVALIYDMVGNALEHGLPDQKREWTLQPDKKKGQGEATVKVCPDCFTVCYVVTKTCRECGHLFPEREKEVFDMGQTLEFTEMQRKVNEWKEKPYDFYKELDCWGDIELFRKAKGYKFAWSLRKAIELKVEYPSKYQKQVQMFIRKKGV